MALAEARQAYDIREISTNVPLITSENLHQEPPLARVVKDIRRNPADEGAYMLPDTGFHVKDQVRLFYENLSDGISFAASMEQVEQDVQGFKVEYLCEQPVFPIVLERGEVGGETRLVGALYGGKSWVEATSSDEREGSVRRSVEEIEQYLLSAEPGAMAVMTSPRGWSGYQSREGYLERYDQKDVAAGSAKEVTYPDSQTYCFQVQQDGSIRGFTLKTDMDIFESEELQVRLGVAAGRFENHSSHKERIKQLVTNVAYIAPDAGLTIESAADTIKSVKGSAERAYSDSAGKTRTFSEMKALLASPEPLWTLDKTSKDLMDSFRKYASWGIYNQSITRRDLEVALGYTVLKLMREVRPKQNPSREKLRVENYNMLDFDAWGALAQMQELSGCAGGGSADSKVSVSVTPRITVESGIDGKQILCCTCPFCGKEVEAEISGGRISCPNCKKDAPWSQEGSSGE